MLTDAIRAQVRELLGQHDVAILEIKRLRDEHAQLAAAKGRYRKWRLRKQCRASLVNLIVQEGVGIELDDRINQLIDTDLRQQVPDYRQLGERCQYAQETQRAGHQLLGCLNEAMQLTSTQPDLINCEELQAALDKVNLHADPFIQLLRRCGYADMSGNRSLFMALWGMTCWLARRKDNLRDNGLLKHNNGVSCQQELLSSIGFLERVLAGVDEMLLHLFRLKYDYVANTKMFI